MKMWKLLCLALVLCLTAALAESPYEAADGPLTLFAINVGKGDALLLNSGAQTYLIDAGPRESWGALSRALQVLQVTHLDGVILTHTDRDHAGGALPLATSPIAVDAWYASPFCTGKDEKHPAVAAAAVRGQQVTFLHAGDELPLGTGRLIVAGPRSASQKENNNSLVLVAEGGGGRMLLTGDMEFAEEKELIAAGAIPHCSVLKVAHHGKDDATSKVLLRAVKPEVAVISTSSEVEPDSPSTAVLTLLVSSRVAFYQTQDATSGVLVTIDQGVTSASLMDYRELPEPVSGVTIAAVDHQADCITLRNTGLHAADVSGWYITSDRGGEIFVLPAGTQLAPGGTLTIRSEASPANADLVWPEKKVWHKTKDDAAALYDAYGRLMDSHE